MLRTLAPVVLLGRGPVMRRVVCQPASNGELRWLDAGEADMCSPPLQDDTSSAG